MCDRTVRASANGKFPKIKFKSSAMDSMAEGMTDESDGLDDAEFQTHVRRSLVGIFHVRRGILRRLNRHFRRSCLLPSNPLQNF